MNPTQFTTTLAAILCFSIGTISSQSQPHPERERDEIIHHLKQEIMEARESGRAEMAERLMGRLREVQAEGDRPRHRRMEEPSPFEPGHPEPGHPAHGPGHQPDFHHLQVAIDNLHAAGRHELAEELQGELEQNRRLAANPSAALAELHGALHEQSRHLERLSMAQKEIEEHIQNQIRRIHQHLEESHQHMDQNSREWAEAIEKIARRQDQMQEKLHHAFESFEKRIGRLEKAMSDHHAHGDGHEGSKTKHAEGEGGH